MQKNTYKEILQAELLSHKTNIALCNGEIHLWIISLLPDKELLSFCTQSLSKVEKDRVSFLKFERAINNYIISQGVLRTLLARYLNIRLHSVNIGSHKKGKPYSIDDPSIFFNISNSGEYCIFAFTRNGEIGIDLEKIRELPDLKNLIQVNFTQNEKEYINSVDSERLHRFFRYWTIKESYLKAIGEGMRLSPENIEFVIESKKIKLISVRGVYESEDWNFSELSIIKNYASAITYKGNNPRLLTLKLMK